MKLNPEQIGLIVNALRDKARGDREVADEGTKGLFPAEVAVLNTAAVRLAETLRLQAALGDELADVFENAVDAEVRS